MLLFIFLPLLVYVIYPPEVKSSPAVPAWAGEELKKMGTISGKEIGMALLAMLALGLWIFGGEMINATTVAIVILSLMVIRQDRRVGRRDRQQSSVERARVVRHSDDNG
jgi:L-tartrate/succinate antiporter